LRREQVDKIRKANWPWKKSTTELVVGTHPKAGLSGVYRYEYGVTTELPEIARGVRVSLKGCPAHQGTDNVSCRQDPSK